MTTVHPTISWAQRSSATEAAKNVLYISIEVQDPVNSKVEYSGSKLTYSADLSDKKKHYALDLDLFDEIDTENSHKHEAGNKILLVLRKKNHQDEYWPRLTKEKLKLHYVKTDFDKWVDEDEQDEQPEEEEFPAGGLGPGGPGGPGGPPDFSGLGGLGGLGGGEGGPGGNMDFAKLMQSMGGMGGAGGPGGDFDISQLASQLGQAGGAGEGDDEDEAEAEAEK